MSDYIKREQDAENERRIAETMSAHIAAHAWRDLHKTKFVKFLYDENWFFGKIPHAIVVDEHKSTSEKIRFPDRLQAEYRCSCDCGDTITFKENEPIPDSVQVTQKLIGKGFFEPEKPSWFSGLFAIQFFVYLFLFQTLGLILYNLNRLIGW